MEDRFIGCSLPFLVALVAATFEVAFLALVVGFRIAERFVFVADSTKLHKIRSFCLLGDYMLLRTKHKLVISRIVIAIFVGISLVNLRRARRGAETQLIWLVRSSLAPLSITYDQSRSLTSRISFQTALSSIVAS